MNHPQGEKTAPEYLNIFVPLRVRLAALQGCEKYFSAGPAISIAESHSPCESCCLNCQTGRTAHRPRRKRLCPREASRKNLSPAPGAGLAESIPQKARP